MKPFEQSLMTKAAAIAFFMAIRGMKRKSLTTAGAVAAWVVGFLSISCGLRGFLLLLFYLVATKATKFKMQQKEKLDKSAADSSCRGASQVLACSLLGVIIQLVHVYYFGEEKSIDFQRFKPQSTLACALIAHHATSLADTLASELGILSKSHPVLITSGKIVPPGTNGGVTLIGTMCSALGGLIIGVGAILVDHMNRFDVSPLPYVTYGTACGVIGSLVDSILGATVQVTYYDEEKHIVLSSGDENALPKAVHVSGRNILSNAQVNVASILITSFVGSMIGPCFFS